MIEVLLLIGGVLLYFLPTIVHYRAKNADTVFIINLFFGWTLLGWIIALIIGKGKQQKRHKCTHCNYNFLIDYDADTTKCPICNTVQRKFKKEGWKPIDVTSAQEAAARSQ
jgi:ribosomal protein L37AE/L43A